MSDSEYGPPSGSVFLSPSEHGRYWHDLAQERIAEVSRLRSALEFYAGTLREDGNGYVFAHETFRGETARNALSTPNK